MLARVKLKGIDGGPHKRWSMWFNSMQREEPYQNLTVQNCHRESEGKLILITGGAWLSSARVVNTRDLTVSHEIQLEKSGS